MIDITKYENLMDKQVVVTCKNGSDIKGILIDWLDGRNNDEEESQEDSILVKKNEYEIVEIYISDIRQIKKS